jgi:23S rRNA (adenine2503-C2)-methyltransferase
MPQLPGDVETKTNLLDLSVPEMEAFLQSLDQPRYRARQVYGWLYRHLATDIDQMSDLPESLRRDLSDRAGLSAGEVVAESVAQDGLTRKVLLRLADGVTIESVLMRYPEDTGEEPRRSVCVSSQVGCPVGCAFCATGRDGLVRQLSVGEIVGQVLHFARELKAQGNERPVTNIVFMGQGEPLLNWKAVRPAIEVLNSPFGFNLGARHITISTAGVVPGVEELASWPLQVGLAVSLHAPDDNLRNQLVPLNRRYPIEAVLQACRSYFASTGRRVTFEYALISGLNDETRQARHLAERLAGLPCHVNLIPLNATPDCDLLPSPRQRVLAFQRELLARGVACTVRAARGTDIDAACGQLRRRSVQP